MSYISIYNKFKDYYNHLTLYFKMTFLKHLKVFQNMRNKFDTIY